jgi:hypothetical protein
MLPSLTRRFGFCSVGPVCFLARINRPCIVPAGHESRTRLCAACCVLKTAAWRRWPGLPSSRAKNSKHTERRTERPTWLNWSKEAKPTKRDAGSYQGAPQSRQYRGIPGGRESAGRGKHPQAQRRRLHGARHSICPKTPEDKIFLFFVFCFKSTPIEA